MRKPPDSTWQLSQKSRCPAWRGHAHTSTGRFPFRVQKPGCQGGPPFTESGGSPGMEKIVFVLKGTPKGPVAWTLGLEWMCEPWAQKGHCGKASEGFFVEPGYFL